MSDNKIIRGRAAALRIDNLDTDQIMPKQFLRGIDKSGLAQGLLYNLRHDEAGQSRPEFVLNRPRYKDASILVGGANFGCGSSREHAVWGLLDYGIKAVIAPGFGEIFYSNSMGNRLLLVALPAETVEALMSILETRGGSVKIDIDEQLVRYGTEIVAPFELSPRHKKMFLEGLDVIGMSLSMRVDIDRFSTAHWAGQPWLRDVAARMKVSQGPG